MTELQKYLAEEVAEDHVDGIITRREALRRLGLLGVGMAAATSMLAKFAAEAGAAGRAPVVRAAAGTTVAQAAVATEPITFAGPDGRTLLGAWAAATKPRGGVLVVHENRGLNDHIRSVAGRLAGDGYSALAIDLLSEEGGTGSFPDEASVAAALAQVPPERFDADMTAGVAELRRRLRGKRIAAVGFCFGGGMVWRLLATREVAPGRRGAVLRPVPRRRRPLRVEEGRGARDLRGPGHAGERHARRRRGGAAGGPDRVRARHLPEREPRVLQRHGSEVRPRGGGAGLCTPPGLVRPVRGQALGKPS